MGGSLLVSLSAQFPSTNIADLQGGLSSTPDEASWVLTVYAMASLVGVVTSGVFIRTLSIGRYMVVSAIVFAATALACATGPALAVMIGLRAVQGFAAGGFGPAAFVAVFMVAGPGGPRLPFVITLLAFVLLFPGTLGPVISGFVEDGFGWQALFLIQAGIGAALAFAARAFVPHKEADWSALKTDWAAVILLSVAVSTLILVFSQGTRRFWFESDLIAWSARRASVRPRVLCSSRASRRCRSSSHGCSGPGPWPSHRAQPRLSRCPGRHCLSRAAVSHRGTRIPAARDREADALGGDPAAPRPAARMAADASGGRAVGNGARSRTLRYGYGARVDATALFAGDQFSLMLVLFAVGQLLFLGPALVIGSSDLKFPDLPTASVFFNLTTLGGTAMGVGLVSHLVTEREKFHSNVLTENVSLYDALDADRAARLAGALANRLATMPARRRRRSRFSPAPRAAKRGCFHSETRFLWSPWRC